MPIIAWYSINVTVNYAEYDDVSVRYCMCNEDKNIYSHLLWDYTFGMPGVNLLLYSYLNS